jgi:hypothetical protein
MSYIYDATTRADSSAPTKRLASMDTRKQVIVNALRAFADQRPGLDPRNYISHGADTRGRAAYRSESRRITQDLADARTLLAYASGQDAITADMILNADPGGRLTIKCRHTCRSAAPGMRAFLDKECGGETHEVWCEDGKNERIVINYCTGQYWPVEYRRAVCRLLSQVLWGYVRDHVLPDVGTNARPHGSHMAQSPGDWLRAHFKREFGRRIASRYFD